MWRVGVFQAGSSLPMHRTVSKISQLFTLAFFINFLQRLLVVLLSGLDATPRFLEQMIETLTPNRLFTAPL
jgi:hypothetical protein